ncbi:hypothetical protein JCM8208_006760, partial [Rhodotorula glutinis]
TYIMPAQTRAQVAAAAAADNDLAPGPAPAPAPSTPTKTQSSPFTRYVQREIATFNAASPGNASSAATEAKLEFGKVRMGATGEFESIKHYSILDKNGDRKEWLEQEVGNNKRLGPSSPRKRLAAAAAEQGQEVAVGNKADKAHQEHDRNVPEGPVDPSSSPRKAGIRKPTGASTAGRG